MLEKCQCTPYFHWAGMKEYRNFCRGPSLLCMNEVLSRLGEFNEVLDTKEESSDLSTQKKKELDKKKCLAACENQVR